MRMPSGWVNDKNPRAVKRTPKTEKFPDDVTVAVVHLSHAGTHGKTTTPSGEPITVLSAPFVDDAAGNAAGSHLAVCSKLLAKWHGVYGAVDNDLVLLASYTVKPAHKSLTRVDKFYHYAHKSVAATVRLHLDSSYFLERA